MHDDIEYEELESESAEIVKRAVIKEELVKLTGDFQKAVILNQLIYWSQRIKDFDNFIAEEKRRAQDEDRQVIMEPKRGWIYKKAEELSEETMLGLSGPGMRAHIKGLIDQGWIGERRNPKNKMDKTMQYRVNITKIQLALLEKGYTLNGYKVRLDYVLEVAARIRMKESLDRNKDTFVRSNESLSASKKTLVPSEETEARTKVNDNRSKECLQQYQRLLPESTSQTIHENTSEDSRPPYAYDQRMKGIVSERVTQSTFETFIYPLKVVDISNGVAFLEAPTDFQAKHVSQFFIGTIHDALVRAGAAVAEVKVFPALTGNLSAKNVLQDY